MADDVPTEVAPGSILHLDLVGGMTLRVGFRTISLVQRKSRALVAYLALTAGGVESRERLVGLLWSESEEDKARASLRQSLHELKDAFGAVGFHGLKAGKLQVTLDPVSVRVDVLDVLAEAQRGRVHPLLTEHIRLLDDLLSGIDTVDPAFGAWVLARKQSIQDRLTIALERIMRQSPETTEERDSAARALLGLDPTHEEAVRHLMKLRADMGDVGGALAIYKALWNLLDEEFDVEPSRETQEVAARTRLAQPESRVAPPPVVGRVRTRLVVAVSSFDASGARPEQRYLIEGFRRDLIATLVRFREWTIRDSSVSPVGEPAGGHLDEYMVEASAFEIANEVRLALVLRDQASGEFLWSERVTISPDRWFEVQMAVVRRLAAALNVHISMSRLGAISHASHVEPSAYDLWLRGQAEIFTWTQESLERNLTRFRSIVTTHPTFAPAYSTIAQMLNGRRFMLPGTTHDPETLASALTFANEAVRLDPVDARGHLALGWAHAMAGRHDRAAIHHDIAYDLNENDAWTLVSVALGAAARGAHDRAKALAELSTTLCLTPTPSHWAYLAQIAFIRGDHEACVEAGRLGAEAIPSAPGWLVAALGHLKRHAEARTVAAAFVDKTASRWVGPQSATPSAVADWFVDLFPFADPRDRRKLAAGLAAAGLVVSKRID